MKTELAQFGFRVLGDALETRRLADAAVAFSAHAADDPKAETHRECYLSAFQFGDDFKAYLKLHDTTKGFDGLCWARWLWFDIDRASDLQAALVDARKLAAFIVERYGLDGDELLAFFSGSKGFHLGLPLSLCGTLLPSADFNRVCRRLAEGLADLAGVAIDVAVYDKVRLFRAPNSTHPKTGLRKRWLTFDELLGLKVERVIEFAREPLAFDVPEDPAPNEQARLDWQEAVDDLKRKAVAMNERRARNAAGTNSGRLNRATFYFIRDGALSGDRHRALFAAAANLAEFGCPALLAHELLTEAALDCGLSPSEVRRVIDCGLAHRGKAASHEAAAQCVAPDTQAALPMVADVPTSTTSTELQAALQGLWSGSRKAVTS